MLVVTRHKMKREKMNKFQTPSFPNPPPRKAVEWFIPHFPLPHPPKSLTKQEASSLRMTQEEHPDITLTKVRKKKPAQFKKKRMGVPREGWGEGIIKLFHIMSRSGV